MSSILDNTVDERKSSGSGTMRGYHVEFRTPGGRDTGFTVEGIEVTGAWRRLPMHLNKLVGAPIERGYETPPLLMAELVGHPCAEALRWQFVAMCRASYKDVETRIVEHEITWSWSSNPIEAFAEVDVEQLMYPTRSHEPNQLQGIPGGL